MLPFGCSSIIVLILLLDDKKLYVTNAENGYAETSEDEPIIVKFDSEDDEKHYPLNLTTTRSNHNPCDPDEPVIKRFKPLPLKSVWKTVPTVLPSTFCKSMTYKKFQEQQLMNFEQQSSTEANEINAHTSIIVATSNLAEIVHQCDICLKVLSSRTNLRQHKLIHNTDKPFICKECGNGYTSAHGLRKHSLIHSGIKPHVCNICGMAFTDASNMRTHVLAHSKVKKFKCHLCEKSYTRLNMLKAHVLTHSGLNKFTCEFCDKGFGTASNLKMHMNTHTREVTYICKECGDSFTTAQRRDTHMLSHDGSLNKPYMCTFCAKGYMLSSGLKRHIREKHSDILANYLHVMPVNKTINTGGGKNESNSIVGTSDIPLIKQSSIREEGPLLKNKIISPTIEANPSLVEQHSMTVLDEKPVLADKAFLSNGLLYHAAPEKRSVIKEEESVQSGV